jgi:hypothetical protein
LGPDLRAVEAKKVFMALQWKAAVEPKVEVEATVQLEAMCGSGCRLGYTQLLSMPK